MAVTYRRFLRLKLQVDASHAVGARAQRISAQVEEEGGLDARARTLIVHDIGAAYVTEDEARTPDALANLSDAELIRELVRAEAMA